ncbi:hypothetical protein D9756_005365 [Leucocoprinus leucothites]|uniref:Mitochondrial intermembrane space import and assembly protein 40 n=1 Tax=Leucocoprinus leucothites TaxID=201217 RepID=A0A8H5D761_9AGAR|nr:hypothetical protein D9756_005365 [Leucoagaricus leucothites]
MLARFTRLPLRRCLHTQTARSQSSGFARTALGVSAVTATYLTWHLLSDPIALDSHTTTSSLQKSTVSSKPPSKATVTSPSGSTPETSIVPDSEPPSEPSSPSRPSKQDKKEPGESPQESSEQPAEGEEGSSQPASGGAFNPETGEINWDCPCLGGMAHGPCGPDFREAFSCFIFSEQEPKGIDCVEKFKAMQDCFRRHPEVYSDEIMDDDEEEEASAAGTSEMPADENVSSPTKAPSIPQDTSTPPQTSASS